MIQLQAEVERGLRVNAPVVALESTLIAHGLPWPVNLETARAAEAAVREEGAVPATVAVWEGRPTVGLEDGQLQELAQRQGVLKASRRDLAAAVAQRRTAATTVAATMFLAQRAGIRLFATGGLGGVHRGYERTGDASADLYELSRLPVAAVCAGAKSILDLPRTLELLESLSVPVVGFGADEFPAFYVRSSGVRVAARADTAEVAADLLAAHWQLGGAGVVLAQPAGEDVALDAGEFAAALRTAERLAQEQGVRGPEVTPFLLARLAELTQGRTLQANRALVVANARLAARVARALPGATAALAGPGTAPRPLRRSSPF
jgi:pseudouridine-5'-phosphate glycosidase